MTTTARFQIPLIVLLFLLLPFTGCSSTPESKSEDAFFSASGKLTGSGTFPIPSAIKGNVAFWRNVYGKWGRDKVAIHDNEYMGVIYEVVSLPASNRERFMRARKAHYKRHLEDLETRVRVGLSPSSYQRTLYNKLVDAGGKRAVYGASDRVRSQRGIREHFRRGMAISGRYDKKFREIFRKRGVPEDLAYLPHVESSFQAHARSNVGAAGMWQFMRGTGRLYNMTVNGTIDERLDPVIAAEGAARYLSDAYRKLRSWPLAITSYNHGQAGMARAKAIYGNNIGAIVRRYKGPLFKFASRNFYAQFVAAREVASHPKRYFPEGIRYQAPLSEDRLVLRYSMPASWVARHYGVSTYRLANLNRHWRKPARQGRANLPAGTTVWLPDGALKRVRSTPTPMPVMLAKAEYRSTAKWKPARMAKAEPRRKPIRVTKAKPRPKPVRIARAKPKPKPIKVAKARPKPKRKPVKIAKAKPKSVKVAKAKPKKAKPVKTAKVHVVKPNETLYRVSVTYDVSVDQLRRLNRMGPNDTNIRPGQRLRVSG